MNAIIYLLIYVGLLILMLLITRNNKNTKGKKQPDYTDPVEPIADNWMQARNDSSPSVIMQEIDLSLEDNPDTGSDDTDDDIVIDLTPKSGSKYRARKKPVPPADRILKENELPKTKNPRKSKPKRGKK